METEKPKNNKKNKAKKTSFFTDSQTGSGKTDIKTLN